MYMNWKIGIIGLLSVCLGTTHAIHCQDYAEHSRCQSTKSSCSGYYLSKVCSGSSSNKCCTPCPDGQFDMNFMKLVEGFRHKGYIPKDKHGHILGQSGVTIGIGVDLGQHDKNGLRKYGVSDSIIRQVQPYLGLKKEAAQRALDKQPLNMSIHDAMDLSHAVLMGNYKKCAGWYDKDVGAAAFASLKTAQRTAIMSLFYQYGSPWSKNKSVQIFWADVTKKDWTAAVKLLRNFGDYYVTRRNQEADLLQGCGR